MSWISALLNTDREAADAVELAGLTPDTLQWDDGNYAQATALVTHRGRLYQVSWQRDAYPDAPDWDALTPYVPLSRDVKLPGEHGDEPGAIRAAWRDASSTAVFHRFMTLYYGASCVAVIGGGDIPELVCFDTPEWRNMTGESRWDGDIDSADSPAGQSARVWRDYFDGDVFGVVIDRVHPIRGLVHVESVWGMYGEIERTHAIDDIAAPTIRHDAETDADVIVAVVIDADDVAAHWDTPAGAVAAVRAATSELIGDDDLTVTSAAAYDIS